MAKALASSFTNVLGRSVLGKGYTQVINEQKYFVDCMVIGRLIMNFDSVGILQTIWTKIKRAVIDQIDCSLKSVLP